MKLSDFDFSRLKSFVVPALILVTVVLLIPFAFIPLLDNAKKTNDSLKQEQERLGRLSEKLDFLNSLDEKDINDKLASVELALPVGKSLAPLMVGVHNLAVNSGFLIEDISLSPGRVGTESAKKEVVTADTSQEEASQGKSKVKQDRLDRLVLSLALRGSIGALEDFLSRLESAKRLSFAGNVKANLSEERGFEVRINLLTPFRPIPKLAGDILAEPLPLLSAENEETLKLIEEFTNFTDIQINEVNTKVKDPFKGR